MPLTVNNAEQLAQRIRETYWLDNKFPVDPVSIGQELGIRIVDVKLPDDVAGAFLKKIGEDPIIMLREDEPINRKRFTCAHELGHYVYRLERGHFENQNIDHIDKRDNLSGKGTDKEEISANRFAAALLMPEEKVKELKSKSFDLYSMSNFFKVSPTAMNFRLSTLGIKI